MTLRSLAILGLVFGLAACQVPVKVPNPVTPKSNPRAKVSAAPSAAPSASTTPSSAASPSEPPASLVAASSSPKALVPQEPTRLLKGVIRIDAHYVVSAGGGNVISNGTANVLAVKGGSLISNNGSNLTVPTRAAATGLRLLAETSLDVGEMLPAEGVAVVPISMVTGQPLGPAVLTDGKGAFAVTVPESLKDNVRLLSAIPASGSDDPILKNERLRYSVITAPSNSEETVIDEDTAITAQFIRFSFTQRLLQFLTLDDTEKAMGIVTTANLPEFLKPQLALVLQELRKEAKAAGIDGMTPTEQLAMAQRVMDAVQTRVDMAALTVETQYSALWKEAPAPALPVLVEIMKRNRERAGITLAATPEFFKTATYLTTATQLPGFQILKPTDFNEFLVREYMILNQLGVYPRAFDAMDSIGALMGADGKTHMGNRLEAAGNSVMAHHVQAIFTNKAGAKDAAIAAIRGQ